MRVLRLLFWTLGVHAACSFPRPPDLLTDAMPDAVVVDALLDDGGMIVDAAGPPRCAGLRFPTPPWPTTGAGPRSIASADVNGDGKTDLITANRFDNTVSVLLSDGNGTFQAKVDYGAVPEPEALVVTDVNGDAKPDIIIGSNSVSAAGIGVLLSGNNGTFGTLITYPLSSSTHSVAVADINADGKPDILATTSSSGGVNIFRNNGNGTFASPSSLAAGRAPQALAIADVNNDGKLDVVTINSAFDTQSAVSTLLGNGDGTFGARVDIQLAGDYTWIAVADIDNDAKLDVIISDNFKITILFGDGKGAFPTRTIYETNAHNAFTVSDVNADGRPDLVVTPGGVLLNSGRRLFADKVSYATEPGGGLTIADLNQDGKPDIAISGNDNVNLLRGKGDGTFTTPRTQFLGFGPTSFLLSDVNHDNKLDAVATTMGRVSVLISNGDGSFAPGLNYDTDSNPGSVVAADVNHDTNPDLIMTNSTGGVTILLGDAQGKFSNRRDYPTGLDPKSIATADINGDNHIDIIVANAGEDFYEGDPGSVSVLFNDGTGDFSTKMDYPAGVGPTFVTTKDLNSDGRPDVVVLSFRIGYDHYARVLLNSINGLMEPVSYSGVEVPIGAADINSDGNVDLVAGRVSMMGYGNGTFSSMSTDGKNWPHLPSLLSVRDVVGSSAPDIVATGNGMTINVFEGNGDGTFKPRTNYPVGGIPRSLEVGDVDGDGQADLVTTFGGTITVLLGTCTP